MPANPRRNHQWAAVAIAVNSKIDAGLESLQPEVLDTIAKLTRRARCRASFSRKTAAASFSRDHLRKVKV
jgi:hypothetical protein